MKSIQTDGLTSMSPNSGVMDSWEFNWKCRQIERRRPRPCFPSNKLTSITRTDKVTDNTVWNCAGNQFSRCSTGPRVRSVHIRKSAAEAIVCVSLKRKGEEPHLHLKMSEGKTEEREGQNLSGGEVKAAERCLMNCFVNY